MQTYPHGTVVVVLDCVDLERAADFWCEVLGYTRPHPATERYLSLVASHPGGMELLLQRVPEGKSTTKNRMHFDLRCRELDAEVARVVAAGAQLLTVAPYDENDWRWHILADPDGNEFCILQPPEDFSWPTAGAATITTLEIPRPSRLAHRASRALTSRLPHRR